ncbi:hypothetical protein BKA56DRAFT_731815 [Ilyonectria sp. MPI-CAGE-AT-0026]|nr:hypothetical protein BKA56DRAFT_731815 [Ilyonectria sp. MPI-CAGE-AT-0026]
MTVAMLQLAATPKRYTFVTFIAYYNVFCEIDGSGPFMTMAHGFGAITNVLQPLMEIFSSEYTVVWADWPGLGHRGLSKTGTKITMASLVDVLGGVMDVL